MKAIYAGTFDPFHLGHLDIAKRASKMFVNTKILVLNNYDKDSKFKIDERVFLVKQSLKGAKLDIPVVKWEHSFASYIETYGADVIVRGIRNSTDFEYETMLEQYNRDTSDVEIVYLRPQIENLHTSSTLVRNFIKTQKFMPLHKYVSPSVHEHIIKTCKVF